MGKRFEGEEPTFMEMLMAYQMLGLADCLGAPGEATAFATRYPMSEYVEFSVVPGQFTAKEIDDLRRWAS